ncbi:hypothetical protein [Paraglaciecola sp. MB-3u-78]|jgi:hypothetical protein|nr:hypothetical protein [Paraglaciecola sp. MB-3u-78]
MIQPLTQDSLDPSFDGTRSGVGVGLSNVSLADDTKIKWGTRI